MAISKYFDKASQVEFYKVRVVRKNVVSGVCVQKRAFKIPTEAEARRIEKRLLTEAERELVEQERKGYRWDHLVEDWATAAREGDIFCKQLSSNTIDDYLNVIKNHTSDWNELSVTELDRARVWRVLDKVDREVSIARRKRLRSAIDSVFNWAIVSGRCREIREIPTQGFMTTRKEDEKLPEILNLEEIKQLLLYARQINHPWYPIWSLALMTGMRSGELFALEWASVDIDNGMIYVHRNWTSKTGFGPTKGRYWRGVPVAAQLTQFLNELKLKRGNEKFVLPHFQEWKDGVQASVLREFCEGCGIPSVRFHTLRACFATQLIKDGVAPAVVMKVCGWRDLKTMQRYIRLAGIEIKGATDGLKLLPEAEVMGRVVELFGGKTVI